MLRRLFAGLLLAAGTAAADVQTVPGRMIKIETNAFVNLKELHTGTYTPSNPVTTTNNLQYILNWMDAHWQADERTNDYIDATELASATSTLWSATTALGVNYATAGQGVNATNAIARVAVLETNTATKAQGIAATNAQTRVGIVEAWTNLHGAFNFTNTFMGYPKVPLTTAMLSSSASAGNLIPTASFSGAFDNDFTTYTTSGTNSGGGNSFHTYVIDLGESYIGVLTATAELHANTTAGYVSFTYGGAKQYSLSGGINTMKWGDDGYQAATISTNHYITPVMGRYLVLYEGVGTAAGTAAYRYRDVSFWGVTNGFNGYTGVP